MVAELAPVNRWYYLSKVAKTIEEKKKEVELLRAKETIYQEKIKQREREERQRVIEEQRWYETHPEEVLEEAIEWQLVFWGNPFAGIHY